MIAITGVSKGLGRALVNEFIAQGQQVVGIARSESAISELASQYPAPNHFEVVDVSDADEVAAWAQRVLGEFGSPDLLINNAALINQNAPLWEVPVEEFVKLTHVNINGVFFVCRAFLPSMIEAGRGVVVNLSSGWGRSVAPDVAPYCATKYAIEGMTQALASELPGGLAAIPLNPGIINTEMLQSCFGSSASDFPTAEQWAKKAVPFLLSLGHSQNGQPLTVPG